MRRPTGLMTSLRYLHLDVFAATPGGGNHLGVVLGASDWSTRSHAALRTLDRPGRNHLPAAAHRPRRQLPGAHFHAAQGNTLRRPPERGQRARRAGLRTSPIPQQGMLWQECGAGVLPIRVQGHGRRSRSAAEVAGERIVANRSRKPMPLLPAALSGVGLGALPPALVDGGRRWWLAEVADEAGLRAWQPDHAAIGALARASDSMGLCAFARSASPD